MQRIPILLVCLCALVSNGQKPWPMKVVCDSLNHRVEIYAGPKLFTSYIWPATMKKPLLWPVISPSGNAVTRSFPLAVTSGERADHPHHAGIWLNYGDVNGFDFWNSPEPAAHGDGRRYGTIHHMSVEKAWARKKSALLAVSAVWTAPGRKPLLDEKTEYRFRVGKGLRMIDRITTLSARGEEVRFDDNKEGFFAIRVCSSLELPAEGPLKLTDETGDIVAVDDPGSNRSSGDYLSSNGITGEAVWGTRASWMRLSGTVNGESLSVIIFDHPGNPGYPTYWHARNYGLFAANPLGQKVFSEGRETLGFTLPAGHSVTFRYRMMITSGQPAPDTISGWADAFSTPGK